LVALVVLGRAIVGALPMLRGAATRHAGEDDEA